MKFGPYRLVWLTLYSMTINNVVLPNVVAIDGVTFAKAVNVKREETGNMSDKTSPVAEPTTLNDRQDDTFGAEAESLVSRGSSKTTLQ